MMSYQAIRDNDWTHAYAAYADNMEPLRFDNPSEIEQLGKNVRQMGSYVPKGWKLTHRIFVDKGWGGHARSIDEVISILKKIYALNPVFGVALSHEGQFQIHLDVYFRSRSKTNKAQTLLSNEREVYEVDDDIFTDKDFAPEKIFTWTCPDCGTEGACPIADTCPTCTECGASYDKGDL